LVLHGIQRAGGLIPYTLNLSQQHKTALLAQPLDTTKAAQFEAAARTSLRAQADIEASPQIPFADYVAQYLA
jgi:gamma-glutamylcysteine synthetase